MELEEYDDDFEVEEEISVHDDDETSADLTPGAQVAGDPEKDKKAEEERRAAEKKAAAEAVAKEMAEEEAKKETEMARPHEDNVTVEANVKKAEEEAKEKADEEMISAEKQAAAKASAEKADEGSVEAAKKAAPTATKATSLKPLPAARPISLSEVDATASASAPPIKPFSMSDTTSLPSTGAASAVAPTILDRGSLPPTTPTTGSSNRPSSQNPEPEDVAIPPFQGGMTTPLGRHGICVTDLMVDFPEGTSSPGLSPVPTTSPELGGHSASSIEAGGSFSMQRVPSLANSVTSVGSSHSQNRLADFEVFRSQSSGSLAQSHMSSSERTPRNSRPSLRPSNSFFSTKAAFEFPDRMSSEALDLQFNYLEQALRDADRKGTGKLTRQQIKLSVLYSNLETSLPAMLDELVKLACEQSDTDGSGRSILISKFLAKLRAEHDTAVDVENIHNAKIALEGLGPALIDHMRARSSADNVTITAAVLTSILTNPPFVLPPDVASSMVRCSAVQSGQDGSVDTQKLLARVVPTADEELFAPVRLRLIEKYHSILAAFRAFAKDKNFTASEGKTLSRAELLAGIFSLGLNLPDVDIARMCQLADADGNGKIEYQEFAVMFGVGDKQAKKRREIAVKVAERRHTEQLAKVTRFETRIISILRRPGVLGELRSALRYADEDADGRVNISALTYALKTVGGGRLDFNGDDGDALLRNSEMDDAGEGSIDYNQFLDKYWSLAEALVDAQARIRAAVRGGGGSMLSGFQRMDAAANGGRSTGKIRTDMLLEAVRGLGVEIPPQLGAALMEIADDDKNGWVTYDEFSLMVKSGGEGSMPLGSRNESSLNLSLDSPIAESGRKNSNHSALDSPHGSASGGWSVGADLGDIGEVRSTNVVEAEIREVLKGRFDSTTAAFNAFDKNKDGWLSRSEVLQALESLQLGLSKKELSQVMAHVDKNGDGKIDLTEFREVFGHGIKADAKRKQQDDQQAAERRRAEGSEKMKKIHRMSVMDEAAAELSVDCERQFWRSVQAETASLADALSFLKGAVWSSASGTPAGRMAPGGSGKAASKGAGLFVADRVKEEEFVESVCGLEFLRCVRECFEAGGEGVSGVEEVLRGSGLPPMAARELLRASGLFSQQDCVSLVRKSVTRELFKSGGKFLLPDSSLYAEGQARALFRCLDHDKQGFIDVASLVRRLSAWQVQHPEEAAHCLAMDQQLDGLKRAQSVGAKRPSLCRASSTRSSHGSSLPAKRQGAGGGEGALRWSTGGMPGKQVAGRERASADKALARTSGDGGALAKSVELLGEEERRLEARRREAVEEEVALRVRAKEVEKAEAMLQRRLEAAGKREEEVDAIRRASEAVKAQAEARLREAFEMTAVAKRREAELERREAGLKKLGEDLQVLQKSVMEQRERAVQEMDAERRRGVESMVAACEKKVEQARLRREGKAPGRSVAASAVRSSKQDKQGCAGGGAAELRAVAALLQSERDGYFERLVAVERIVQGAGAGLPASFIAEVSGALYGSRSLLAPAPGGK